MVKKEEKPAIPEARYPEITRILETENFDTINRDFTLAFESLEKISKMKGLGKASDASKGMKAIERTMDLLKELLLKKYQLMKKGGVESPRGKK